MTSADASCVFLFETTHQAMWAEEVAREHAIPAEVVSAPADAKAKCGLALRSEGGYCPALRAAMESEGVEFRTYGA